MCPRQGLLQLGSQTQQATFATKRRNKVRADRDVVGRPVQRHRHGRVAADVEQRGEGRSILGLRGIALVWLIESQRAQQLSRHGCGGRQNQVVFGQEGINQLPRLVKACTAAVQIQRCGFFGSLQSIVC